MVTAEITLGFHPDPRAGDRSIDRAPGDRSEASRYEAAASKLFSLAANVVRFNPRISAARFLFP